MSTISSYLQIANNLSKWRAVASQKPRAAAQTKYFQDNIGKAQSADDLLKDARLFDYAMTAFGLGDMTYAKGLMKKVLQEGVSNGKALANTLNSPRILAFAKAFDFVDNGAAGTSSPSMVTNIVNRYTENALETDQGRQNPGVQLALYFQQNAPNVTSAYGILADKNLLAVVQTALGISPLTAAEPIDVQNRILASKVNVADFQDPKKLQSFISRFAAMYDANSGNAGGPTYSATNAPNAILLGSSTAGGGDVVGIDQNILLQAQNLSVAASARFSFI